MYISTPPPPRRVYNSDVKLSGGGGCDKCTIKICSREFVGNLIVRHHPVERMVAF